MLMYREIVSDTLESPLSAMSGARCSTDNALDSICVKHVTIGPYWNEKSFHLVIIDLMMI